MGGIGNDESGAALISRRGLFRLLTGSALSPVLKPLAALVPESRFAGFIPGNNYGPPEVMRIWYDTYGREIRELRKRFDPVSLPPRTGKTIQFFTYKLPESR